MSRKKTKPEKPPKYQYDIGEIVIYTHGLYSERKNQKCEVITHNIVSRQTWYKVKFLDGLMITTPPNTLKKKEEIQN